MNIQRALLYSALLQALVGFLALVGAGKLPVILIGIGSFALFASFARVMGLGTSLVIFYLSRMGWNAIMVTAFLASAADLVWGTQDLLQASLYVLILLMAHKLCALHHQNDFLHLYVISFLEFLSAAVLTTELWYAIVFAVYLLTVIWTLLLWHLHRESEEAMERQGDEQLGSPLFLSTRFFWTTNLVAAGALCVTLAIFFMMPRTGFGFFQKTGGPPLRTSGFSEKVDLGGIGAVKQDQSLVMRVQFPDVEGPPSEELYFRGVAFDRYNGRSWTNTFARRRLIVRNDDGIFTILTERSEPRPSRAFRQQILIEALDTSVLFGVPVIEEIQGNFLAVQTDGLGGWSLPVPVTTRFQYVAISSGSRLVDEERVARSFDYPEDVRAHFLQLPPMSLRIAELAVSVTQQARTPFEQIVHLQRYLMTNYRYSLDIGLENTLSPLENFLFTRKTGYCEHYATAMVVMLRTLGIPSRLITGFLPGEWNEFGNYYRIRQQDAHAWVEVYFPRSGWITFDPTPTVGSGRPDPIWRKMGSLIDSAKLKWDRFVIQYSFRDQLTIAQAIRDRSERMRTSGVSVFESLSRWVGSAKIAMGSGTRQPGPLVVLLLIGASVLAGVSLLIYRSHSRACVNASPDQAMARMYTRMLRLLATQGLTKAAQVTPLEFSKQIASEWHEAGCFVTRLTELYCRVRYGREPLLDYERRCAEQWLQDLRTISSWNRKSSLLTLSFVLKGWKVPAKR